MCFHERGESKRKISTDLEYTVWVVYGQNTNTFIPTARASISKNKTKRVQQPTCY